MAMTIEEIATECQLRGGDDPDQDRAQAYKYIARHMQDRPGINLAGLMADLELWIGTHQQSVQLSRAKASGLQRIYEQQAAVYQEVVAWAKGESDAKTQRMSGGGWPM